MAEIAGVYVEWDDKIQAFRVYLVRTHEAEGTPMESAPFGASVEARLYRAAFVATPRDFQRHFPAGGLGWRGRAAAERVARAARVELERIDRGEPATTDDAIRLALALTPRPRRAVR